MLSNNDKQKMLITAFNVYIFKELYKYNFIKSKTLTFAKNEADLQNKVMHVVKSSTNAVLKNEVYEPLINRISFSNGTLTLDLTYINNFCRKEILDKRVKAMLALAPANDNLQIYIYPHRIMFTISGYHTLQRFTARAGEEERSMQQKLDAIVNAIMYIPQATRNICEELLYVNNINEDYTFSYLDFYYILTFQSVDHRNNPTLDKACKVLAFLHGLDMDLMNNNRVDLGDPELNKAIISGMSKYSYYAKFEDNETISQACNQIITFGEQNGYDPTNQNTQQQ